MRCRRLNASANPRSFVPKCTTITVGGGPELARSANNWMRSGSLAPPLPFHRTRGPTQQCGALPSEPTSPLQSKHHLSKATGGIGFNQTHCTSQYVHSNTGNWFKNNTGEQPGKLAPPYREAAILNIRQKVTGNRTDIPQKSIGAPPAHILNVIT